MRYNETLPVTERIPAALRPGATVSSVHVNQERDRRIEAGLTFNGVRYQTRQEDRENVAGAAQLATLAIIAGVQPGDLRWHGGETDFVWIAEDNSAHPMDAHTVIELGRAMAQHKSALIFAARALKDMQATPIDFRNDAYWPEA